MGVVDLGLERRGEFYVPRMVKRLTPVLVAADASTPRVLNFASDFHSTSEVFFRGALAPEPACA